MNNGKFQLTAKWAIAGVIAGLGFVGLNQAIGQARFVPKPPSVDGWTVKGVYDPQAWPQLAFSVTVTNTLDQTRSLNATVRLVRQVFKGNFTSRVSRPSDMEKTDLESQTLMGQLTSLGSKTFSVSFKTQPDPEAAKPMTRITYLAMVDIDGKPLFAAAARPKVAANR